MRILLVTPPWIRVPPTAYGGVELVVSGLADGLVAAGHEVTLVAPGGSHTRADLLTVFDEPRFEQFGDARLEALQALCAYRRRNDFDIVHDHTAAVGPAIGALVGGPPVIHTLHNPWDEAQAKLARAISPPVRLVAVSNDQAKRAPDDVSVMAVVHNGIPIERYPLVVDKDEYLLWVGRASPDKGPETAIEVARRLRRPLVIAIKVNQHDEAEYWETVLAPLIESSPSPIEVIFRAGQQQKAELMAHAAALLVPISWDEPFGLVMAEANACGTPVVAFARGAASEVIADRKTGFVIAPGDVDAFYEAVAQIADIDPVACRDHVVANFSAERMVAGYQRAYTMTRDIGLRTDITVML